MKNNTIAIYGLGHFGAADSAPPFRRRAVLAMGVSAMVVANVLFEKYV